MSKQYQPTSYYDWVNRTHGVHLDSGNYQFVPYDYYAGDELHIQNVVFRNSQYVTYDNTHVRFLNKSDIHVFDTSNLVIHDSGTLSMYTSASGSARKFVVDEYGRVGIGLDHVNPVSNKGEAPSFDLDVRGQVGIEDYIYHNDDTDTYMLFGSDLVSHNINTDGSINSVYPSDQDEVNFRIGGIDMLQMKEDDTQDEFVVNKNKADVDTIIRTSTNTQAVVVSGDGSEVVINGDGNNDTDFRIESDKSEKMLFVDTSTDMITLSGPGGGDDTTIFDIQGNSDDDLTGASILYVDPTETVLNKDGNDHNFRVVAQGLDPQQNTTDTGTDGSVQNHTAALSSHALFVDATNGRVGIGHNNPATTLHVAGSAHIEGDLWVKGVTNQIDTLIHATSAMDITNIGTGPALTVTQSGAQPVAVFWDRDNNDELQASLYLDDMTKMGIGTSNPAHAVHISDTVESQAGSDLVTMMVDHNYNHGGIGINSTTKDTQNHVRFLSGGDVMWQMRQPLHYTTDPDSLRFTHSSRTFDVITMIPNGDVGIGRSRGTGSYGSAPQYRLQIAGDTNGSQDIVQITTNDTEIITGQEQGLTFGQGDASFSKVAGFYQGSGVYGLKLYSCLETSRETETRGNFRYNDLAGITLLGDNKTGINIEAPTAQLHVYRGDQHETQSGLTVHRGDTSFDARLTAPILNLFNGSAGSTEVFRVQGDGKTGIGTDNPDTALHVQRIFDTGTADETRTALHPVLTLATKNGTGSSPYTGFGPAIDFNSVNYDITSSSPGPYPIARIAASITNNSSVHTGGSLRFFTTPLDTATSTDDLEENMIIMPSGSIGMGTSRPGNYDGEADNLVIQSQSNTGLTVSSLSGSSSQHRGNLFFADGTSGNERYRGGITYDHADDNLSLRTAATERMWIANNGNVGIGLDTPACSLDVNSTIRAVSGNQVAPSSGVGLELFAAATRGYMFNYDRDNSDYLDLQLGTCLFLPEQNTPTKAGNIGIGSSTPHTKLYISSTDGLRIPVGTTAQRPTSGAFDITGDATTANFATMHGTIRYNTTQSTFEGFGPGNQWGSLGGVIDVDRDTYWTAVNDLNNLHDLGGNKTGEDEFDPNTEYPGDVDYLRAFTQGFKRFAITNTGDTNWYFKTGGNGTTTPYTYDTALTVNPHTAGIEIITPVLQKNIEIKTANVPDESDAQAGDIHIKTGLANNRGINPGGAGGVGGDLYLTAGDGANATLGQNGGRGGNITLTSGTKGDGHISGGGLDGANGKIMLEGTNCKAHFNQWGLQLLSSTDLSMYNSATSPALMFSVDGATGAMTAKAIDATSLTLATALAVSSGGTGVSSLTDKAVCVTQDSSTDQIQTKVMTTPGALLIGGASGPEVATLTQGTDMTITNANNQITIAHGDTGNATSVEVQNRTFVNKLTVDGNGHVTEIGTALEEALPTRATLDVDTDDQVQFDGLGVGMAATNTTGEINAAADVIAFSSSDERLKENITPISDPIEKLSKISGYEFDWKDNDECSHTGHDVGVIAQEIEQVLPDIVTTRESGYKAVKYEKLTALLIEVTKSQQAQIDELTRKVEQLSK